MDATAIDNILSLLTPAEVAEALRFVDAWERWGTLSAEEADEWRRRIVAKHRFQALDERHVSA